MLDQGGSYTFLGTVDNVVERYPWRFPVGRDYILNSLMTNVLLGRRVILNDGYLLLNSHLREMLLQPDSLLRGLVRAGHVLIAARGYAHRDGAPAERVFGLHEMPGRMVHIAAFRELVARPEWPEFRASLEAMDRILGDQRGYMPWSPYDTGQGYRLFAEKLLRQLRGEAGLASSPRSLGLGRSISHRHLQDFLSEFRDGLAAGGRIGPRDLWERLAQSYAQDSDSGAAGDAFLRSAMRLANEIYHYNFSMGLMKAQGGRLFIETQPSAAFDDLLFKPSLTIERPADLRAPYIPDSLHKVKPDLFLRALAEDEALLAARQDYLAFQEELDRTGGLDLRRQQAVNHAFSTRILLAFRGGLAARGDDAVDMGLSEAASLTKGALGPVVAGGLAYEALGVPGAVATAVLVHYMKKLAKPVVLKQYRLIYNDLSARSPEAARRTEAMLRAIKFQKAPISLQIDPSFERALGGPLRLFQRG